MATQARLRTDVRVLVLHESELIRVGCRALLGGQPWVRRCLTSSTVEDAAELSVRYGAHVALVHARDLRSAGASCARLRSVRPDLSIVLLATSGRLTDVDARTTGAVAMIDDAAPSHRLIDVVRAAASGTLDVVPLRTPATRPTGLSDRERQIVSHLSTGASNREIGRALLLSPQTVKHHASSAFRKLGVHTRLEAVLRAQELGLLG